MIQVDWTRRNGWGPPKISPLHNLSIHPGAKVLHYAIEVIFRVSGLFKVYSSKLQTIVVTVFIIYFFSF